MMHLGRRFALGDLMRGFSRTVGRTSRLSVAVRALQLPDSAVARGSAMNRLTNRLRELGPYTAVALLLPGGSLIALAAWTFRKRRHVTAPLGRLLLVVAAFSAALILPGNI
ncbi:MAG TPA: hypothetical protein VF764_04245 [Steroidobacteraceae bacterium]